MLSKMSWFLSGESIDHLGGEGGRGGGGRGGAFMHVCQDFFPCLWEKNYRNSFSHKEASACSRHIRPSCPERNFSPHLPWTAVEFELTNTVRAHRCCLAETTCNPNPRLLIPQQACRKGESPTLTPPPPPPPPKKKKHRYVLFIHKNQI